MYSSDDISYPMGGVLPQEIGIPSVRMPVVNTFIQLICDRVFLICNGVLQLLSDEIENVARRYTVAL